MSKKIRDAWMTPIGDCRVREITEDELKYLRSLDPSLPLVPLRPIGESVSEQENVVSKLPGTIQPVLEEFAKRNQKLKERLAAVEASEARLSKACADLLSLFEDRFGIRPRLTKPTLNPPQELYEFVHAAQLALSKLSNPENFER